MAALRTLLYYDLWEFPLTGRELFLFLPVKTSKAPVFSDLVREEGGESDILERDGYFFVKGRSGEIVTRRRKREQHARWMWRMARASAHIIKRFPFVRAVFVSGELSKNATGRRSDVDFFILTEPGRLWIARTLLILFKKVILFNRKKFFCLNAFRSTDALCIDEKDIYIATEIAHLKPLYNITLFATFMERNRWVNAYFPNFRWGALPSVRTIDRRSVIQYLVERVMGILPLDRLDTYLMNSMQHIWTKRYPQFDQMLQNRIFRCTKLESRAYVGNFQEKVLALYHQKLVQFGISI